MLKKKALKSAWNGIHNQFNFRNGNSQVKPDIQWEKKQKS